MWCDPASPYEKLELTPEHRELHTTLLSNLPRECFPTANPLLLADNRDTQIVGETLAQDAADEQHADGSTTSG